MDGLGEKKPLWMGTCVVTARGRGVEGGGGGYRGVTGDGQRPDLGW